MLWESFFLFSVADKGNRTVDDVYFWKPGFQEGEGGNLAWNGAVKKVVVDIPARHEVSHNQSVNKNNSHSLIRLSPHQSVILIKKPASLGSVPESELNPKSLREAWGRREDRRR